MTTLRAHWKLAPVVASAAATLVLSLSACGSSKSSDSGAAANDSERAALDFAGCMRNNGVPSFPDPVAKADGSFGFERPRGVEASVLDEALDSCRSEARAAGIDSLPAAQDPQTRDQLLKFSRCMRRNGVPDFPDPKPNESGSLRNIFGQVDLQSPRVQEAMESCDSILSQLGGALGGTGS
jgi:hypothetical protein